jgi:hypothetical protein
MSHRLSTFESTDNIAVYRVHWLKGRAQKNRWAEELRITENEMEWVTRFFFYKRREWKKWLESCPTPSAGHVAYAARQMDMWEDIGDQAYIEFSKAYHGFALSIAELRNE